MRPREAAVMPLPSEEVTPPVTNTNFGTGWTSGVFPMIQDDGRASKDYANSGDGKGKAVQNDEPGSIASGVRRIGRDVDRVIASAIVQVSVESQAAEARVPKLTVLEAGVLDDRDETRPQEAETIAHRDGRREAGSVRGEATRRHIEPLAEIGRHVRVPREDDRAVVAAQSAEQSARPAVTVDHEPAHDHVGPWRHVALQPVGCARSR